MSHLHALQAEVNKVKQRRAYEDLDFIQSEVSSCEAYQYYNTGYPPDSLRTPRRPPVATLFPCRPPPAAFPLE
eukprot:1977878-Pyramimonas_sp.AAC.1